ncbi:unnamed protein product [Parnassius apollo]|uniref:(apollo) hypothetical protein n=1 Tax=Parnassius apollo TaxID=110799 RepID=A0A8S3XLM8_PARAO|nr:unnamed protein product [Parnassius apollo]
MMGIRYSADKQRQVLLGQQAAGGGTRRLLSIRDLTAQTNSKRQSKCSGFKLINLTGFTAWETSGEQMYEHVAAELLASEQCPPAVSLPPGDAA